MSYSAEDDGGASVCPSSPSSIPESPFSPRSSSGLLNRLRFRLWGRKNNSAPHNIHAGYEKLTGLRRYTYKELYRATKGFSTIIGEGGSGVVYRGFVESDAAAGRQRGDLAVKKLKLTSSSLVGEDEFVSEIDLLGRLRHKNVVQMLGWCREKDSFLTIYEYIPNGSLASFIYPPVDPANGPPCLPWEARYGKVMLGLADALLYLQEEWGTCVIHRDIKANNVLLDDQLNPKLTDFEFARINHETMNTSVVVGTCAHLAPEYLVDGRYGKESDIYAFGVVALEVACGGKISTRKLGAEGNLIAWVRKLYDGGEVLKAADPRLDSAFVAEEMERLLLVGLWCTVFDPAARPTITQILQVLRFDAPLPLIITGRHEFNSQFNDIYASSLANFSDSDECDTTICIQLSAVHSESVASTSVSTNAPCSEHGNESEPHGGRPPIAPAVAASVKITSAVSEDPHASFDIGEGEDFDIGIPAGYRATDASGHTREHHLPVIDGFLASIRKMLLCKDEPPSFDVLLGSIRQYTGFLVTIGAPLEGWSPLVQLVLWASKQAPLDSLATLAGLETDAAAEALLSAEMEECTRALEEDGATLVRVNQRLSSAWEDHALLLGQLADLRRKIEEDEEKAKVLYERRARYQLALNEKKKKYASAQLSRFLFSKLSK